MSAESSFVLTTHINRLCDLCDIENRAL